jgi:hypothetical protein
MLDDIYTIEFSADFHIYRFKSVGPKGVVHKVVRYNESEIDNLFNLGFGDVDPLTGIEDDLVATNNGDSKKVLKTVVSTLYTFTKHYPDSIVMASGSNSARTRLYRIGISANLDAIEEDFTIWGYYQGDWMPFNIGIPYDAFLVKRKL